MSKEFKSLHLQLIIFCLLLVGVSFSSSAQQNFYNYRLGVSAGAMSYYGDLVDGFPVLKNYIKMGYGAQLEKSITKGIGLKLSGTYGHITYNDRTLGWDDELETGNPNFNRALNFETKIWDAAASVVFYPDNDRILSDRAFISPYFSAGFGVTFFDVKGDLKDADGNDYNYSGFEEVVQDEDFETDLRELDIEGANYSKRAWHIPLGLGLKFRISDRVNFNLETNVKYALTDYLDDVKTRGNDNKWNRDVYAFSMASINYNFGLKRHAFKSPVIIADQYAMLSKKDTDIKSEIAEAESETEEAQSLAEQNSKKHRKAKKKAADKAAKAAKKQAKADAKAAKKAQKSEAKGSEDSCKSQCKALPKKERKACKKACKVGETYIPLSKKESAPNSVEVVEQKDDVLIQDPLEKFRLEQEVQQQKLDSLKLIVKEEKEEGIEKTESAGSSEESSSPSTPSSNSNAGAPAPVLGSYPIQMPSSNSGGINEGDIRSLLNERDIQDLKLQMEINKLKQELGGSKSDDIRLDMYRLEMDRLRQENSDNKILNKLELLQLEIQNLKSENKDSEKEIRIEKTIIDSESNSKSKLETEKNNSDDELQKELEKMKMELLLLQKENEKQEAPAEKVIEETDDKFKEQDETMNELKKELERLRNQLKEQESGDINLEEEKEAVGGQAEDEKK